MAATSSLLAAGRSWRVSDIVCTAGPHDRPFEERHDDMCIALVTAGTFQCRSPHGAAVLTPGALLLGNAGACFECGHEHGTGDRCLAFNYAVDYFERLVADIPGARRHELIATSLMPGDELVPLLAAAETARDEKDEAALEEIALRLAASVTSMTAEKSGPPPRPSARDERRVSDAVRRIEMEAADTLSLAELARTAATSPYHFLRIFRTIVGMTPHQFLLRTRLHRAAVRLRRTDDPVSAIAFEAGFNDLSTFNRRFRRVMGASPTAYRARR